MDSITASQTTRMGSTQLKDLEILSDRSKENSPGKNKGPRHRSSGTISKVLKRSINQTAQPPKMR